MGRNDGVRMVKDVDLIKKHAREITVLYFVITGVELLLCQSMVVDLSIASKWLLPTFNLGIVPLGVLDYHYKRLFNGLVFMLGMMGIITSCLTTEKNIVDALTGAMAFGGGLYLIRFFSKGNMGLGDVKLGLAAGIWLGPQVSVAALYISFALGGAYVLCYSLMLGLGEGVDSLWKVRGKTVPFGPFLAAGSSIGLIYGESIVNIYLILLGQTGGPALLR